MMKRCIVVLICAILGGAGNYTQAQDEERHKTAENNHGFHRLTLIMGNAFINNSFSTETDNILIVPAFGVNYDFFFNSRWGLGLHSDILLQQFKVVQHSDHQEVERDNPVAICGILLFKPHHRWTLLGGYGVEIEKHENFQIIRFGAEYGIDLPKNWELGFSLEYDIKPQAYNSLLFGIGFSKLFYRKNK